MSEYVGGIQARQAKWKKDTHIQAIQEHPGRSSLKIYFCNKNKAYGDVQHDCLLRDNMMGLRGCRGTKMRSGGGSEKGSL